MVNLLADARWKCVATDPGAIVHPAQLDLATPDWMPVEVPGTAAAAQRAAAASEHTDFDASDWWFVADIPSVGDGPWRLELDGVATGCDVWVDDVCVASSDSMFAATAVVIDELEPKSVLALRCRSLRSSLRQRRPRGRWRSTMLTQQGLRWVRTTHLGRASVFGEIPAPVGPWRPVRLLDAVEPHILERDVIAEFDGMDGHVSVEASLWAPRTDPSRVIFQVGARLVDAEMVRSDSYTVTVRAHIVVTKPQVWWPHTHGTPATYGAALLVDDHRLDLGPIGFRTISADTTDGGFGISVNGTEIFCRGAVWSPTDPVSLYDPAATRTTLERCVDAGFNVVRVPGTMIYEQEQFWSDCAELGIMVWQDAMLSTVDPPTDDAFAVVVVDEMTQLLRGLTANPALTVVSGGNEIQQQAAMMGLPPQSHPLLDDVLPAVVREHRPDVVYVPSTPTATPGSGDLSIRAGSGIAHYFGVGAYRRPVADLRAASVRFAAECLAFAIPPSPALVEASFGAASAAGHHPRWKAAVPRDRGASWDFEDVRDHYVREIFDVDPPAVRWTDPERYLDLGRAALCEVFADTAGYWRRADSRCAGALVLTMRDLVPGAGWGLLDSTGTPKAPWFVLSRLYQPIAAVISDDGLDGIRIHVVNDTDAPLSGALTVRLYTTAGTVGDEKSVHIDVPARGSVNWLLDTLLGRFTDAAHTYRFGRRSFDCVQVELADDTGAMVTSAVRLLGPAGRPCEHGIGLTARAGVGADGEQFIDIRTERLAQYVVVELDDGEPTDSWFHLPAGTGARVGIRRRRTDRPPTGRIRCLNGDVTVPITAHESTTERTASKLKDHST